MVEKAANGIEAVTRAALALMALAVNAAIIWHFYGDEIRRWWRTNVSEALRRQWADYWDMKWSIPTEVDH